MMKAKNHKDFKQKEAYLEEKLELDQGKLELKLKELQFEYIGKVLSILKGFLSKK